MPKITLSYYPWITQSISGAPLAAAVAVFGDLLRQEMGNAIDLRVLKEMEIPDQLKELETPPGDDVIAKIGLLNPIGYALARQDLPAVEAVAVIQRNIKGNVGPIYNAQLYTHRKTAIKQLKDARGRSMAFGSPQSTSNFLVPAIMMMDEIHPLDGI